MSHFSHETPAGLPHNSQVEIVKTSPRVPGFHFTVRDASGQEWRLGVGQVTCGSWFELTPGKRVPEWDSRALDYLEDLLAKEAAAVACVIPGTERKHDAMLENIRDQLRRYGRKPRA